ncbi:MAG: alpha amylase N-terminal ig-like domain-containing protein, partial [Clostridiales bacterium]|nr:alpha amylase N-terminal ig-like domain-containing protein [Clostridiales bacterium]
MRIDTRKLPGSARPALCRLLLERPFNYEAVYSDESAEYVDNSPPERGEAVTVKLRLLKGQNAIVKLIADGRAVPMQKTETAGYFDYYTASLEVYNTVRYYFSVEFNGNVVYYDKAGLQEEAPAVGGFSIIPGFAVPDWAKGAVMYQIFVDRFRNGDASNDPVNNEYAYLGRGTKHMDWNDPVQNDDVCCFYGGDLAGIIEKLPYLKDLGVEALYLNPVFVSPSSHKY